MIGNPIGCDHELDEETASCKKCGLFADLWPPKGSKHTGRKPLLEVDPKIGAKICANIVEGVTIKDAAGAEGVGESTIYQWLERAKGENAAACYREFAESFSRARAKSRLRRVKRINKAAAEDWRADAHMLALSDPEGYAQRKRHEHTGAGGKPIEVNTYKAVNLPEVAGDDDDG